MPSVNFFRIKSTLSGFLSPAKAVIGKFSALKQGRQNKIKRHFADRELDTLNHKIDKLLSKLEQDRGEGIDLNEENEIGIPNNKEFLSTQTDGFKCVICMNAKATMQTFPCKHKVVCRICFVRTIQYAVLNRSLPLKCVVCRGRVYQLRCVGECFSSSTLQTPVVIGGRSIKPLGFSRH